MRGDGKKVLEKVPQVLVAERRRGKAVAENAIIQLLFFKLERAGTALHARARPFVAGEMCVDVVAVPGAAGSVAAGDIFFGAGAASGVKLGIAVGVDFAFDQKRAGLTLGAVQAAELALLDFADEAEGVAECITGRLAGDRGKPLAIERLPGQRSAGHDQQRENY